MEKIFGIPMQNIMYVMVVLLVLCFISVVYVAIRRPVIFKLGVRNIPRRKAQTVLIIVGLMLATLIMSAALGTGDTLNRSVNTQAINTLGPVDEIVVASRSGDGEGQAQSIFTQTMPESNLEDVRALAAGTGNVDGVGSILLGIAPAVGFGGEDVSGITGFESAIPEAQSSDPRVYLAGMNQDSISALGGLKTENGDAVDVDALDGNGVYMGETGARNLNVQPGDHIGINLGNTFHVMEVVGIIPDSVMSGAVTVTGEANVSSMLMNLSFLQKATGQEGRISAIGISNNGGVRGGLDLSDSVFSDLKTSFAGQDSGLGIVNIKADQADQAELLASVFVTMFVVFGLFSIGVGILLIVLIFTMLAAERRSEMGMERAVGAQRQQLIQQFLAEGAGYTLLSGLVGTALGVGATWVIVQGFKGFAEGMDINLYVSPRSMLIAYSLGVVITFVAVAISSWRVSKLNVVAAIRDIPDVYSARRNRKQLIWGIIAVVAGLGLTVLGLNSNSQASFYIGMTIVPFGIAAIVTYFGIGSRLVLTLAGIYVLILWFLPDDISKRLFGELNGDIEMFFVSGICMVAAATLVIVQNLDLILSFVEALGGRVRGWLASIRLAVSYPGAHKGRTGMTIAMFSLIVFSLVMVASINQNFANAFLGDNANAGMDIRVDVTGDNPIDDFTGTLEQTGFDMSMIDGVGQLTSVSDDLAQIQNSDGEWKDAQFSGADDGYLDTANLTFTGRAQGYDSDQAIMDALKNEPNVAVVPSFYVPGQGGFGPAAPQIEGLKLEGTFAPVEITVSSGDGEQPRTLKVIGVMDQTITSVFTGIVGPPTVSELPLVKESRGGSAYYIRVAPGQDVLETSRQLEKNMLPYGADVTDLEQELKDSQSTTQSFMYILQGFMGLGMVVGIAAVGVIAYRAVVERRQQIGMLRALGFQRTAVSRFFVTESAIVVILGVLSGMIMGLILAWQLLTSDDFTQGTKIDFTVPWTTIIATVLVAVVAALIMAWMPARQASRTLPAEALRYE